MDARVLAVVGSQEFRNPLAIPLATELIARAFAHVHPKLVISGGARGVDELAARVAIAQGFRFQALTPRQRRWKPDGFAERNLAIAHCCTVLMAIRCAVARTYGSGWTADRAQELGRTVVRVIVPETGDAVNLPDGWFPI